jgi:hypothetical protein
MLSVTDLLTLQNLPSESDLTLQTIQEFYEEHLCNRVFVFNLDDEDYPVIKLRFEKRHLCHLLGIQYVVKGLKKKSIYSGEKGYKQIENGTVTFDFLKKTNIQWYKSKKKRMLYTPFIYQIVANPTIIEFTPGNLTTRLDVDIIFYNQVDNTYLHLGLEKDTDSDFYYPKSFFDRKKDDHIEGRRQLTVLTTEIETNVQTT